MRRELYQAEHEAFRAAVRQFLDRHVWPYTDQFIADHGWPRELWREAGKQGYLGLEVPERYGGSEAGDYRFEAVLAEEFSAVNLALSSGFGVHSNVVAPYLVDLTTEEQRRRWLPDFCSGDLVTAIAMTEPSGGSDLASLRTTAVHDGADWVLNGSKTFITNGGSADLVLVAARTGEGRGAAGISLIAVEADRAGFRRGPRLDKVGQPEADTCELFLDDVRVPVENLVGELGGGFAAMMRRLPQERLGAAIGNVAHAAQILSETIGYAKERTAFGRPIGSFQHTKFRLAELVTMIEVSQAFIDRCVLAHNDGELSAVDAAKAKWWSAQVQCDVLDACVQVYGGYGYMNEYRVARAWRDARVSPIWAGTNEIMKELIGRDLGL